MIQSDLKCRIILTSVLLVSKFSNDVYYSNEQVGQVGGVQLPEMNLLETYFLEMVDWNTFVTEEEYERYCSGL